MLVLLVEAIFSALTIIISSTAGVIFGLIGGAIVGFFFTDPIMAVLNAFGVDTVGLQVWQLGLFLGFVSGFFKANVNAKSDD